MELYKEVLEYLFPILVTVSLGFFGYIIKQLERIKSSLGQIKEWKAKIDTVGQFERKDIDGVANKLEGMIVKIESLTSMQAILNNIVSDLKTTMVKTWDKVLDLEKDLQRLESRVNELSRVVFNKQSN